MESYDYVSFFILMQFLAFHVNKYKIISVVKIDRKNEFNVLVTAGQPVAHLYSMIKSFQDNVTA